MKILLSGICGFAGSNLAHGLLDLDSTLKITGVDNFSRAGSHLNIDPLRQRGVKLVHADLRSASDLDSIAAIDWIIDAAANPSVLAGIDGTTSSRQLLEHNLYGTVNLLELAKRYRAGFVLLSTSRVYSIRGLASIPVVVKNDAFAPDASKTLPPGVIHMRALRGGRHCAHILWSSWFLSYFIGPEIRAETCVRPRGIPVVEVVDYDSTIVRRTRRIDMLGGIQKKRITIPAVSLLSGGVSEVVERRVIAATYAVPTTNEYSTWHAVVQVVVISRSAG